MAGAGPFERGAWDHVDGTGEGGARGLGGGRVADFDARDAVDGKLIEVRDAAGAVAGGTGEIEAADGDGDVGGRYAVHRDRTGLAGAVIHRDAREKFHDLARRAVDDGPEFVGGDDVHDGAGEALFVDGDGGAVHFFRSADDKLFELDGIAGGARFRRRGGAHCDVMHGSLAGGDVDGGGLGEETGEEHLYLRSACRHARETVVTRGVAECLLGRAFEGEAGSLQISAAAGVEDAALNGAGGGVLGDHRGSEDGCGEHREPAGEDRRIFFGIIHSGERGRWAAASC